MSTLTFSFSFSEGTLQVYAYLMVPYLPTYLPTYLYAGLLPVREEGVSVVLTDLDT